jgi:hypothetical protein
MACGGYSDHSDISGYYIDYLPPFSYQNTTCYVWNNTNECGESYFVDNSGCYKNISHLNYANYANIPHDNVDFEDGVFGNTEFVDDPAWEDYSFQYDWNDYVFNEDWNNHSNHDNNSGESYVHTDATAHTNVIDPEHTDEMVHTNNPYTDVPFEDGAFGNTPFENDPWYNWNNYRNNPFSNFCNHTDTYI